MECQKTKGKKSELSRGFVLAELLVVVFVIATLTVVIIVNFSSIRDELALKRTVYQFAQDVRRTQEMAMSSTKLKPEEVESCFLPFHSAQLGGFWELEQTFLQSKGYGIFINPNENNMGYKLYADTAPDPTLECENCPCLPEGEGEPCFGYYSNGDCIVKTISIQEKGVIIKEIKNTTSNTTYQKVSINFKPPNPDVNIKWPENDEGDVEIIFAINSNQSKTKGVSVSRTGLIEIK